MLYHTIIYSPAPREVQHELGALAPLLAPDISSLIQDSTELDVSMSGIVSAIAAESSEMPHSWRQM